MIDFNREELAKKSPLVFFHNGLGDFFITLPTIRALLKIFEGRLTFLTGNLYSNQLLLSSGIRNILRIDIDLDDKKEKIFDFITFRNLICKHDLFININPWHPRFANSEYALLTNDVTSVGFGLPHKLFVSTGDKQNSFDYIFQIAKIFDCQFMIEDFAYAPHIEKQILNYIHSFVCNLPQRSTILAIHDSTKYEKMMPKYFFDRLINDLLKEYSDLIIIVFGNHTSIDDHIFDSKNVFFLGQKVPFDYQCGVLSIVDYFIGVDSVFLHVADLFKKEILGLFGPTSEQMWGNRFADGRLISSPTGDTKDIDYSVVYQEIDAVLKKRTVKMKGE